MAYKYKEYLKNKENIVLIVYPYKSVWLMLKQTNIKEIKDL